MVIFQYVSCSWDKTIRVWNAYRKPKRKNRPKQNGHKSSGLKESSSDRRKSSTGSEKKVGFIDSEKEDENEENTDLKQRDSTEDGLSEEQDHMTDEEEEE